MNHENIFDLLKTYLLEFMLDTNIYPAQTTPLIPSVPRAAVDIGDDALTQDVDLKSVNRTETVETRHIQRYMRTVRADIEITASTTAEAEDIVLALLQKLPSYAVWNDTRINIRAERMQRKVWENGKLVGIRDGKTVCAVELKVPVMQIEDRQLITDVTFEPKYREG